MTNNQKLGICLVAGAVAITTLATTANSQPKPVIRAVTVSSERLPEHKPAVKPAFGLVDGSSTGR